MKIALQGFAGEIPKLEPEYLPETHAEQVSGARLNRGNLAPMREDVQIATLPTAAQKVYLHGSTWLSWTQDGDAAPGPVAQDRLYVTYGAASAPKMLYSGVYYPLALAAPPEKPAVTLVGTLDPDKAETVVYAYTWVTSLGEESQPSLLSDPLEWSAGCGVSVAMVAAPPSGRLITKKRVYRSVTSESGVTALFFVAEINATVTTFLHSMTSHPPQEPIASTDYDPPPSDMKGIIALGNGMMAAFRGREVLFCEPFIPHAWPENYRLTTNDEIVGLVAFGTAFAVLTTGTPYLVQGLHPDGMSMERMEQAAFPCLSKRGIVDMGTSAIFPSTHGLVQISQSGAQLLTQALWDNDQWHALTPSTFRAARFQGRYAFLYRPGGTGPYHMAYIDISGEQPFVVPVDAPGLIDLHHHVETGRLCGLRSDGVTMVSVDDPSGAVGAYVWRSKPFQLPAAMPFGAIRAWAQAPEGGVSTAFSLKVYRDGALLRTITNPNAIERLPAGLGERFQIEVAGNCTVTRVVMAGAPDEVVS